MTLNRMVIVCSSSPNIVKRSTLGSLRENSSSEVRRKRPMKPHRREPDPLHLSRIKRPSQKRTLISPSSSKIIVRSIRQSLISEIIYSISENNSNLIRKSFSSWRSKTMWTNSVHSPACLNSQGLTKIYTELQLLTSWWQFWGLTLPRKSKSHRR